MRPNGSILLEKEEELVQSHGMLLLFKILDKDRNKAIDKEEFTWPTINLDNAFDILDFVFETGPLINLILPPLTPNQNTGVKGYHNEIKEDELKYFGHEISSDEMKYETKLILPLILNIQIYLIYLIKYFIFSTIRLLLYMQIILILILNVYYTRSSWT